MEDPESECLGYSTDGHPERPVGVWIGCQALNRSAAAALSDINEALEADGARACQSGRRR